MKNNIKISDIKVHFGGVNAPKDNQLIELLKDAYTGTLLVCTAIIKIDGIKPFSDFRPTISNEFRSYFENIEKEGTPPPLYVYPQNKLFIMSDDYNSYYLYVEKGYSSAVCIVLGEATGGFVIKKSEPFRLPTPTAVVISKK